MFSQPLMDVRGAPRNCGGGKGGGVDGGVGRRGEGGEEEARVGVEGTEDRKLL